MAMTSRERVLTAIHHEEPDRVPLDMGGMRSTGITALAHNRLKAQLSIPGPVKVYDLVQQLAEPEDEVLQRFGVDVVDLGRAFLTGEGDWHSWTLPDGSPCLVPSYFKPEPDDGGWVARDDDGDIIARMPPNCAYFTQTIWPLRDTPESEFERRVPEAMGKVVWGGLPSPPYHLPLTPDGLAEMRRVAERLCRETDYAIMVAFGGNLLEWSQWLLGMEDCMMDLVANPKRVEALLDVLTDLHLKSLRLVLDALGDWVQLIQMGDDLGMQTGPQMPPEIYRRLFKPRHSKIFRYVRENSDVHVFFHCCGGIRPIIGDLIDAGVEVLNPVQTSAAGMDPQELKREFGKELTFWGGGCDTQEILNLGSPEDVRRSVEERMRIFSPGGGFVFNQVHNITPEVPVENIMAMYEAVGEFR
jgi:uroporphyrinogen decarboxylase